MLVQWADRNFTVFSRNCTSPAPEVEQPEAPGHDESPAERQLFRKDLGVLLGTT